MCVCVRERERERVSPHATTPFTFMDQFGHNNHYDTYTHVICRIQWNLYITDTLVQDTFVHYSEVSFIGSVGVAYR